MADIGINNDVEVWPECWPAIKLFEKVRTQWRVSMSGVIGLDYNTLYPLIDRQTQTPEQWESLFDDIRIIEAGAMEILSEN